VIRSSWFCHGYDAKFLKFAIVAINGAFSEVNVRTVFQLLDSHKLAFTRREDVN
jgi:hypothetical protein